MKCRNFTDENMFDVAEPTLEAVDLMLLGVPFIICNNPVNYISVLTSFTANDVRKKVLLFFET